MTGSTLTLFRNARTAPTKRRINDDPMAGLTPVERALAQRMSAKPS